MRTPKEAAEFRLRLGASGSIAEIYEKAMQKWLEEHPGETVPPIQLGTGQGVSQDEAQQAQQQNPTYEITQPLWKWSYEPTHGLVLWPVDAKYGQPHHIEVTGLDFYKYAQGRVYLDKEGKLEILVWADRGPEQWQDEAVEAVDQWLKENLHREADYVTYSSEHFDWSKLPPTVSPQTIINRYFGPKIRLKPENFSTLVQPATPRADDFYRDLHGTSRSDYYPPGYE